MAFKATPEQQTAIDARGNILVSAAAGSGKTAVLVERIIQMLCSKIQSVSADKLLIVTFTNAAAAEMRGRIEKRLEEEYLKNPNDTGILVQKHLLNSAKICTIDSFCIDFVRENFEIAGVAPDFKISDANSLRAIDEKVLSDIVNRYLDENNPVFLELLDIIGAEYDEKNFIEFVLSVYDYSRQLPFPKTWFKSLSSLYENGEFTSENIWYKYAFKKAKSIVLDCINSLANAVDLLTVSQKAADAYLPEFIEASKRFNSLLDTANNENWNNFYNALTNFSLPKLAVVRGLGDIFEISSAKEIYKYLNSKALEKLNKIFYADHEFINSQFKKINKPISLLTDILIEFDEKLFEEYKQQNTYTFHNTEHLALDILCEESSGKIKIKEQAKELLSRFEEVCVDEYQDTNDLQDMLFYVLSGKESNLFVVGDVKQSIYGFRGANPNNFLAKKNRYIPIESAKENSPKKIILSRNFRCKGEACEFINFFFELFMNENTGDIVYNEEECLVPAAEYPEVNEPACEMYFLNCNSNSDTRIKAEARMVANIINDTISKGNIIKQSNDTLRPAKYSDFTILLRSAKLKAPIFANELKKQGIPVSYYVEDFADTVEISIILSLLTVIDNPQNDVELLCVLMSPIFGFTCDDVANLRIKKRDGSLYSALILSAQENEKVKAFLETIEKFRLYAVTTPLPEFINLLINETLLIDMVTVLSDGEKRKSNLLLLCDYASQYCEGLSASIGGFVKYIIKQSEKGLKAAGTSGNSNSVSIMSIHASKGLQFPICIVSDLNSDFNDNESRFNTLFSTEQGIGFKYFDETDKTKYTTVAREVILDKVRCYRLEEELRLLYVAMTRTQDKLILTATINDVEKKADKLKTMLICSDSKIDSNFFSKTKSYCDWLMSSLLLHPNGNELRGNIGSVLVRDTKSRINVSIIDEIDIQTTYANSSSNSDFNEELSAELTKNINFEYPYSVITEIESKTSVSKLANSAESAKFAFSQKPAFLNKDGVTATERGTAMHKVMQFFDFSKYKELEAELSRLYEWQFLSENEYNSLDKNALNLFFKSKLFNRIISSTLIKREMRFLTEVSAVEIDESLDSKFKDEKVIIQGAVDICFKESDGIVILDFKTDKVENPEQLVDCYAEQLNIYAKACEKIFNLPVKEKIIYSFNLSKEITL